MSSINPSHLKNLYCLQKHLAISITLACELLGISQGLTVAKCQVPSHCFSQVGFPTPKNEPRHQQADDKQICHAEARTEIKPRFSLVVDRYVQKVKKQCGKMDGSSNQPALRWAWLITRANMSRNARAQPNPVSIKETIPTMSH